MRNKGLIAYALELSHCDRTSTKHECELVLPSATINRTLNLEVFSSDCFAFPM